MYNRNLKNNLQVPLEKYNVSNSKVSNDIPKINHTIIVLDSDEESETALNANTNVEEELEDYIVNSCKVSSKGSANLNNVIVISSEEETITLSIPNEDIEEVPKNNVVTCLFCQLCGEIFYDLKELIMHSFNPKGSHYFSCSLCEYNTCYSVVAFEKHLREHYYYSYSKNIEHPEKGDFHCEFCGQKFTVLNDSYYVHRKDHDKKILCPFCPMTVKSFFEIIEHCKEHIFLGNVELTCPYCAIKFYEPKAYKNHCLLMHDHFKNLHLPCILCPKVILNDLDKFMYHVMSHCSNNSKIHLYAEPPISKIFYTCEVCAQIFPQNLNRVEHMNDAHCDKLLKKKSCPICKREIQFCNMLNHVEKHPKKCSRKKVKWFDCTVCNIIFFNRKHFSKHKRSKKHNIKAGYLLETHFPSSLQSKNLQKTGSLALPQKKSTNKETQTKNKAKYCWISQNYQKNLCNTTVPLPQKHEYEQTKNSSNLESHQQRTNPDKYEKPNILKSQNIFPEIEDLSSVYHIKNNEQSADQKRSNGKSSSIVCSQKKSLKIKESSPIRPTISSAEKEMIQNKLNSLKSDLQNTDPDKSKRPNISRKQKKFLKINKLSSVKTRSNASKRNKNQHIFNRIKNHQEDINLNLRPNISSQIEKEIEELLNIYSRSSSPEEEIIQDKDSERNQQDADQDKSKEPNIPKNQNECSQAIELLSDYSRSNLTEEKTILDNNFNNSVGDKQNINQDRFEGTNILKTSNKFLEIEEISSGNSSASQGETNSANFANLESNLQDTDQNKSKESNPEQDKSLEIKELSKEETLVNILINSDNDQQNIGRGKSEVSNILTNQNKTSEIKDLPPVHPSFHEKETNPDNLNISEKDQEFANKDKSKEINILDNSSEIKCLPHEDEANKGNTNNSGIDQQPADKDNSKQFNILDTQNNSSEIDTASYVSSVPSENKPNTQLSATNSKKTKTQNQNKLKNPWASAPKGFYLQTLVDTRYNLPGPRNQNPNFLGSRNQNMNLFGPRNPNFTVPFLHQNFSPQNFYQGDFFYSQSFGRQY